MPRWRGFSFAAQKGEGGRGVRRIQGAAAEVRRQPGIDGVAEQRPVRRRDVGEAQVVPAHFPHHQRGALQQLAVVRGACLQGLLQTYELPSLAAQSSTQQQAKDQQGWQQGRRIGSKEQPLVPGPSRQGGVAVGGEQCQTEYWQSRQARHGDPSSARSSSKCRDCAAPARNKKPRSLAAPGFFVWR
ncbi:hypothetical protein D3C78_1383720 [compost metagenome]